MGNYGKNISYSTTNASSQLQLTSGASSTLKINITPAHTITRECPECGQNCHIISLTDLLKSYEECECDGTAHIIEQFWCRGCYDARGRELAAEIAQALLELEGTRDHTP